MYHVEIYCPDAIVKTTREGLQLLVAANLVYYDREKRRFRAYLNVQQTDVTGCLIAGNYFNEARRA